MPKDINENTTLSEILSIKNLTKYGVIKRIRIFLYFHPGDIEAKTKLAELLSTTGYGKEESEKLYKEISGDKENRSRVKIQSK